MYCKHCGALLPSGARFCTQCGTDNSSAYRSAPNASQTSRNSGKQYGDGYPNTDSYGGNQRYSDYDSENGYQNYGNNHAYNANNYAYGGRLQTDRSMVLYILLSVITCGIYGYYFIYKMAADVNVACDGDGNQTAGLLEFILLSFITCGIYSWIWYYKLGNRLADNAPRYNLFFSEDGTTVLMWCLFGLLVCGIGPFIGMYILIKNTNQICMAYNRIHGLG